MYFQSTKKMSELKRLTLILGGTVKLHKLLRQDCCLSFHFGQWQCFHRPALKSCFYSTIKSSNTTEQSAKERNSCTFMAEKSDNKWGNAQNMFLSALKSIERLNSTIFNKTTCGFEQGGGVLFFLLSFQIFISYLYRTGINSADAHK